MNTPDDIAREMAIVRELAELRVEDEVVLDDEGWDSRVYLVNRGAVVFKFPRTAVARAAYPNAIATLQRIDGGDGIVQVPTVRWIGPDAAYFGCIGVVGEQLGRVGPQLRDKDRARIGTDIGGFLAWLHGKPLGDARIVTIDEEIAGFTKRYTSALPTLEHRLTTTEMANLDRFVTSELPESMRTLGSEPRLCHGDLGAYNVVLGDDGRIGVIDFDDMGVFDRSKDFMGLDHASLLDAALAAYGDDLVLRAKIDIRARALPLLDIPYWVANGDDVELDACLDRLRQALLRDDH